MKKIHAFLITIFVCISVVNAEIIKSVQIGDICYHLDTEQLTAEVTQKNYKYTGSIIIPSSITYNDVIYQVVSIGEETFYRCWNLSSIEIPEGVRIIGKYAFQESGLNSITLPNSIMCIGSSAFYGTGIYYNEDNWIDGALYIGNHLICTKNTAPNNFKIQPGTVCVADDAFGGCRDQITSVEIPNSVLYIGERAFYSCLNLSSITLPDQLISIGREAFAWCPILTSITIPASIVSIGELPVFCSSSVKSIDVAPDNQHYTSINGVLFSKDLSSLIECPEGYQQTSFNIPENVISIEHDAFYRCSAIQTITMPNSVQHIGNTAFFQCSNLSSINIGNGVENIALGAFSECVNLKNISIPDNVISIGNSAFTSSGLTTVEIHSNIQNIGKEAFKSCPNLLTFSVASNNPNYCSVNGVLFSKDQSLLIQYPGGKQGAYIVPNTVTRIGESAFYNAVGLTAIEIPQTTANIGEFAFSGCNNLTSIVNYAKTPQNINMYVVYFARSKCVLYVPKESIELYKSADGWNYFDKILSINDKPTAIEDTFGGNSKETMNNFTQKLIRQGKVYILRGEKAYTITGQEVR